MFSNTSDMLSCKQCCTGLFSSLGFILSGKTASNIMVALGIICPFILSWLIFLFLKLYPLDPFIIFSWMISFLYVKVHHLLAIHLYLTFRFVVDDNWCGKQLLPWPLKIPPCSFSVDKTAWPSYFGTYETVVPMNWMKKVLVYFMKWFKFKAIKLRDD